MILRILLPLLCILMPAVNSQEPGHVEGRIIMLSEQSAAVQLASGQVVTANLPAQYAYGENNPLEFRLGQRVELLYYQLAEGAVMYEVVDWVRRPSLLWLLLLFFCVTVLVARFKGLRAFLTTSASLALILFLMLPAMLAGYPATLITLLGVGSILILAVYVVHGLNWSTTAALLGTFITVGITLVLAVFFISAAQLTGFGMEEAMYLLNVPHLDLQDVLLAALLIGALGALTDTTVVQASVVRELAHVNPLLKPAELYQRAMNVGKDHVSSLVNTLVLAYVGAALPLLILLNIGDFGLARALNSELVATEIVRTVVGSIGLMLSVPLSTLIAALLFAGDRRPMRAGEHSHSGGFSARKEQLSFQRERQLELLEVAPDKARELLLKQLNDANDKAKK